MPIEKNSDWGTVEVVEAAPLVCAGDRALAGVERGATVTLTGGSLWEAMGRFAAPVVGATARMVPVDGMLVRLETRRGRIDEVVVAGNVVLRRPWWRGGPLFGAVLLASNSGVHRGRDLLPRAHPNDGRFDVLRTERMPLRQRLLAWARSRRGEHLPHPGLSVTRATELHHAGGQSLVAVIDGRGVRCRSCEIRLDPDRWRVAIGVPTVGQPAPQPAGESEEAAQ